MTAEPAYAASEPFWGLNWPLIIKLWAGLDVGEGCSPGALKVN